MQVIQKMIAHGKRIKGNVSNAGELKAEHLVDAAFTQIRIHFQRFYFLFLRYRRHRCWSFCHSRFCNFLHIGFGLVRAQYLLYNHQHIGTRHARFIFSGFGIQYDGIDGAGIHRSSCVFNRRKFAVYERKFGVLIRRLLCPLLIFPNAFLGLEIREKIREIRLLSLNQPDTTDRQREVFLCGRTKDHAENE